jgi:predicted transcriptional regulator
MMEESRVTKRSRDTIISRILDICSDGASKTRIVYQANLNFKTINPYMDLLIKNELITIKKGRTLEYRTTERGEALRKNFKQINSQLIELS